SQRDDRKRDVGSGTGLGDERRGVQDHRHRDLVCVHWFGRPVGQLPATSNTAYVVRVNAKAGISTPRSVSTASANDLAVTVPFTDAILLAGDSVRAVHITELRTAVNSLCDYLAIAHVYSTADTLYTSLQGQTVLASHFNQLRSQINTFRTNASINVGSFSF